jgi:hypothetical protein
MHNDVVPVVLMAPNDLPATDLHMEEASMHIEIEVHQSLASAIYYEST